ncbi:MAG: hypothetical protein LBC64_08775 [Fibromonadaceae bacterium]|jgi:hypothetical protein|nr:hypothetical protein [Fibromonadaceae bacterium]
MRVLCKTIAFLFLVFFTANASLNPVDMEEIGREKAIADPSVIDYTKVSVYLHPVFLLVGANMKVLLLYSTIEIPLSLYNAPIIRPSVWNSPGLTRVGSDLGFRHYLAGKGEGMYLQPQVGLFYLSYLSAKDWSFDFDWDDDKNDNIFEPKKKKGSLWYDGMLYLGRAYKFAYISIYSDGGIGYGCTLGVCTLIWDANIGLGVSF